MHFQVLDPFDDPRSDVFQIRLKKRAINRIHTNYNTFPFLLDIQAPANNEDLFKPYVSSVLCQSRLRSTFVIGTAGQSAAQHRQMK